MVLFPGFAESAVSFDGQSYLKFLLGTEEDERNFRLALSFRTFQERSLITAANSTKDWGVLQVLGPRADFQTGHV